METQSKPANRAPIRLGMAEEGSCMGSAATGAEVPAGGRPWMKYIKYG